MSRRYARLLWVVTAFVMGNACSPLRSWAEVTSELQEFGEDTKPFSASTQTYEVFFSLHPQEIDRLSNVRVVGMSALGGKTFLRFQTLLNNQWEEGWLDLNQVTAILPTAKRLVTTPEVLLDRQPLNKEEKVKEVRSETVREILREVPAPAPR